MLDAVTDPKMSSTEIELCNSNTTFLDCIGILSVIELFFKERISESHSFIHHYQNAVF